jgi:hypothetical protein
MVDISTNSIAQPMYLVGGNGQPTSATNGLPVTIAPASTSAVTSVASAAADTTILAANTLRKGASVYNTDANPLQLLLSTGTASATNFSVQIASNGYYEVPFGYTGIIKGIWTVDGAGAALVTEYS